MERKIPRKRVYDHRDTLFQAAKPEKDANTAAPT